MIILINNTNIDNNNNINTSTTTTTTNYGNSDNTIDNDTCLRLSHCMYTMSLYRQ